LSASDRPTPSPDGPFPDGKAPDALRTIGEVADALGIRQHVLRYWEEQFPTLKPLKRSGGRRYYRPDDVALLVRIDRLVHRQGYTLRGARLALAGKGGDDRAPPNPVELEVADGPRTAVELPRAASLFGAPEGSGTAGQLRAIRDRLAAALG